MVWFNMSDLALVSHIPTMWCVLNVPNNDLHGADTLVPTPEHPQYVKTPSVADRRVIIMMIVSDADIFKNHYSYITRDLE